MVDVRTSCYAASLAAFSCQQKHWKTLIFRGAPKAEQMNLSRHVDLGQTIRLIPLSLSTNE